MLTRYRKWKIRRTLDVNITRTASGEWYVRVSRGGYLYSPEICTQVVEDAIEAGVIAQQAIADYVRAVLIARKR